MQKQAERLQQQQQQQQNIQGENNKHNEVTRAAHQSNYEIITFLPDPPRAPNIQVARRQYSEENKLVREELERQAKEFAEANKYMPGAEIIFDKVFKQNEEFLKLLLQKVLKLSGPVIPMVRHYVTLIHVI